MSYCSPSYTHCPHHSVWNHRGQPSPSCQNGRGLCIWNSFHADRAGNTYFWHPYGLMIFLRNRFNLSLSIVCDRSAYFMLFLGAPLQSFPPWWYTVIRNTYIRKIWYFLYLKFKKYLKLLWNCFLSLPSFFRISKLGIFSSVLDFSVFQAIEWGNSKCWWLIHLIHFTPWFATS